MQRIRKLAERNIDARGLACPQPVVLARKAMLEEGVDRIRVLVSAEMQAENVRRMAKTEGWSATSRRAGSAFEVTAVKEDSDG
jgi:TusA-related sulfurtransferase